MSRIGKKKVPVPKGVSVTLEDAIVVVKGPKGQLSESIHPSLSLRVEPDGIQVEKKADHRKADALSGLTRSLVANMVKGVAEGFSRQLDIVGVGYRAEVTGGELVFQLGYSHRIPFPLPEGISAELPKPTQLILKGFDKALLGQTAARIRALRRPEPYKGKGIKYAEEKIRRKVGKAGAK
ncbi:MAG: 50S ribosomal protein L6 [bacterium]